MKAAIIIVLVLILLLTLTISVILYTFCCWHIYSPDKNGTYKCNKCGKLYF